MRKEIIFKIVKTIIGIGIVFGILFFLSYSEHHYSRMGFCKNLGGGCYHFYDARGNVWEFYSDERINPEDIIEVKMFSNYTLDNIKDDIIIDYQILSDDDLKITVEKDF